MQTFWLVEGRERGSKEPWTPSVFDWSSCSNSNVSRLFTSEAAAVETVDYKNRPTSIWGTPNTTEHRVRQATPEDWRAINSWRFFNGEWEHLCWTQESRYSFIDWGHPVLANHFPHVAKGDPTKIAFVENDEKGKADRITVMKPGRFLTKFFSDVLTPEEIGEIANKFIARSQPGTLHFAHTADEIEEVYTTGPSSCMAHSACDYSSREHPVRVYAAGDLAVAYIKRGDITARALCWPQKKIYGRVYGDADRLKPALEAEGYQSGSLYGARLLRIEEDGYLVCPYIDGENSVDDCGDYLTIGGSITADSTSGLIEDDVRTCDCCGERIRGDEYHYVHTRRYNEETWCSSCERDEAVWSEREDITVAAANATRLADDSWVSDWYFSGHGWTCEGTDEAHVGDGSVTLADGTVWSWDYFEDNGAICAVTDEYHRIEDMVCHEELGWVHKDTPEAQTILAEADDTGTASVLSHDLEVA